MAPVEVGGLKPYTSGQASSRQLGAQQGVVQHAAQPLSRDLAWLAQRAADVLMVDRDIEQGEPAAERRGQPRGAQMSPQPGEELCGVQRCEFVNTHLVDVSKPGLDGTVEHAQQTDVIEAHDVRDHVPYPPALTQRVRLPLLRLQFRQEVGKIGPLGRGHLQTVHPTTLLLSPGDLARSGPGGPVVAAEGPAVAAGLYVALVRVQSDSGAGRDDAQWRSMTAFTKIGMVVVWAVFVLYLVLLLKLLLFSRAPGSERSLSLIPLASISDYLFSGSAAVKRFAIGNVVGNVVAFVPLGAVVPLLRRQAALWTHLLFIVCASVAVEIAQGIFGVGASDIDDVILNTLGGLLGILFFTFLHLLLRTWGRLITGMAVLSLLTVPILCYFLFAIRLRM